MNKLRTEIVSDLYRYERSISFKKFVKSFFISHLGFRISVLYRINHHLYRKRYIYLARVFSIVYRWITRKYGVDLPYKTIIGYGLYLPHPYTIIINRETIFNNNINIHHGVTIGESRRGELKGNPTIGSNVYFGPGCKVFGNIVISDDVAIGANCVVNKSVKQKAVVVGIPFKIISNKGSTKYCRNRWM